MNKFIKSATLELSKSIDESDMKLINRHTLKNLGPEDVYTFKVMAGDNRADDRNFEPFSSKSIKDMAKLYIGKPMIWDHGYGVKGTEQVARIYDAQAVETGKMLEDGKKELQLVLHAYMLKIDANADLIKEIEGGIKKEVSTSCRADNLICSICGVDQTKEYCRHWAGRKYEGKTCTFLIDGVKDVFEVSFVGIPAQPRAGATKSYNPDIPEVSEKDFKEEPKNNDYCEALKIKERELFLIHEMSKGENHE